MINIEETLFFSEMERISARERTQKEKEDIARLVELLDNNSADIVIQYTVDMSQPLYTTIIKNRKP